ncbi:TPA: HNH endonuclease [Klebsiella aerogenes]|nr:HNH endonuclease [Klebsiella aerogenes]HCM1666596.1 HNH endonuclease [Klebsiella aerogenes]
MNILPLLDRPIAFQRSFIRLNIGVTAALFLSQMTYWTNRSDDDGWVYKTQEEWEEETGLSRYEQEGARKKLRSIGVLLEKKKGVPARLFYKIDNYVLFQALVAANKDAEKPHTGMRKTSKQVSGKPANIHTENTTENIDPSKSPVGRGEGHVLREQLISLLEGQFDFDNAGELHDAVEAVIVGAGFDCQREYPVADRGDGRRGRVDLLVTGSDGEQCGIEIDRINVRDKSVTKLKQLSDGFILVRDGVITERYEFDGITVIGAHPATSSVANISREQLLSDAKKALEFYNVQTGTRCRDMKPFLMLMTPTTTRDGYTLDDVQLVIRWVLATWRRRGDSLPKPANICRVCRFDGYLADAEAWAVLEAEIDPEAIMSGYNEIFADTLPVAELDDDRRRMITRLAAHMKNKTTGAFLGYFEKFRADASDFYFGANGGWRASFDYLMKPETLRKTREGSL